MKSGSANGQNGYFRRVEEKGWMRERRLSHIVLAKSATDGFGIKRITE